MPEIVSGQTTVFKQTTAQLGWTKVTSYDDYALRIVTGSVSTGGSVNFTTVCSTQTPTGTVSVSNTTGSTTLTINDIPSHTHSYIKHNPVGATAAGGNGTYNYPISRTLTRTIENPYTTPSGGGSGGSHSHPLLLDSANSTFTGTSISLAVKYVDVILARRD